MSIIADVCSNASIPKRINKYYNRVRVYWILSVIIYEPEKHTYMNRLVFLFLTLISSISLFSQITFEKTIGSIDDDNSYSIIECEDNSYVLCGYTTDFQTGNENIFVIKIDNKGDTLWTKQLGKDYLYSVGYSICQTHNMGFVVSGFITIDNSVPFLLKLDENGNQDWLKNYSNIIPDGIAYSVIQTNNNDLVFCGISDTYKSKDINWSRKPFLIRADSCGEIIWNNIYGDYGYNPVKNLVQTVDSGFAICGQYDTPGEYTDAYLIKTNQNGSVNWDQIYGGNSTNEGVWSIKSTPDGGFILCGTTSYGFISDKDIYVVKTDQNGIIEWSKIYGGESNDYGSGVDITNDGGYIFCGQTESYGAGSSDFWLIRTDSIGDTLWTRTFGGIYAENASDVRSTNDGGIILCGSTRSFGNGGIDVYIIKTNGNGIVTDIDYNNLISGAINVSPNPSKGVCNVISDRPIFEYIIYDFMGRTICRKLNTSVLNIFDEKINISNCNTGIYFLKIKTSKGWMTKKLIIQQ